MAAGHTHNGLAEARSGGCPYFIVDKQTGPNNRRIANTPMHFVGPATCGASTRKLPLRVHGDHADGIVVFVVDFGLLE